MPYEHSFDEPEGPLPRVCRHRCDYDRKIIGAGTGAWAVNRGVLHIQPATHILKRRLDPEPFAHAVPGMLDFRPRQSQRRRPIATAICIH